MKGLRLRIMGLKWKSDFEFDVANLFAEFFGRRLINWKERAH